MLKLSLHRFTSHNVEAGLKNILHARRFPELRAARVLKSRDTFFIEGWRANITQSVAKVERKLNKPFAMAQLRPTSHYLTTIGGEKHLLPPSRLPRENG